jgi:hypothetical protein
MLSRRAAALVLLLSGRIYGEARFGLRVEKPADPKGFFFAELDGNRFAVLERPSSSVACILYGGPRRYFVEVKLSNRSRSALVLDSHFVTIDPGDSVVPADTRAVSTQIRDGANTPPIRPVTPPPSVEPIVAAMEASARVGGQVFASHLAAFAHENQNTPLEPGEGRLYIFVFDQLDRKKTRGMAVVVRVGLDTFLFPYKP